MSEHITDPRPRASRPARVGADIVGWHEEGTVTLQGDETDLTVPHQLAVSGLGEATAVEADLSSATAFHTGEPITVAWEADVVAFPNGAATPAGDVALSARAGEAVPTRFDQGALPASRGGPA